jgi:glycosyltransferase involved in cell wall biosynthesis
MFAGNVGEAQDFDTVMAAACRLKGTGVKLVIVGDGRKKEWVDAYIAENDLSDVVYMMGRHPLESMPTFFSEADVLFLSLKNDYIFSLTTPAKLQAYMAAGKPVLAMIDGDARQLIDESRCGMSCSAGDADAFAECILKMKDMPSEELLALGNNGRRYFDKHFRKDRCIDHLCSLFG